MMALISLLFMAGIALTFAFWLMGETQQARDSRMITRAAYEGEAATEVAVEEIFNSINWWGTGMQFRWSTTLSSQTTYNLGDATITVRIDAIGD